MAYTIAYPAWPLVNQATAGVLGYSTRGEVAADIAAVDEANAELNAQLAEVDLATLDTEITGWPTSRRSTKFVPQDIHQVRGMLVT